MCRAVVSRSSITYGAPRLRATDQTIINKNNLRYIIAHFPALAIHIYDLVLHNYI